MRDMLFKARKKKPNDQDGITAVETWGIVGALIVFASIYTYIVIGAVTSSPLSINL